MILLRRRPDGNYQTAHEEIIIKKVISLRNSGRRTEREVLWSIRIFGYELPMTHEHLRDAKCEVNRFLKQAVEHFVKAIRA